MTTSKVSGSVVPREFYRRDPREVAPELLNKVIVRAGTAARIVEVEAYLGSIDPASHAHRGETPRNHSMFGPPGHLYVYFTYGIHWCANAVCGEQGTATAVLLRAAEPMKGAATMRRRRKRPQGEFALTNGPAKLCQALGITGDDDGCDLVGAAPGIRILDDGMPPPMDPVETTRVGISVATERRWRWYVDTSPFVSRR
jgi:DNA-3-methyladenine glycosylase